MRLFGGGNLALSSRHTAKGNVHLKYMRDLEILVPPNTSLLHISRVMVAWGRKARKLNLGTQNPAGNRRCGLSKSNVISPTWGGDWHATQVVSRLINRVGVRGVALWTRQVLGLMQLQTSVSPKWKEDGSRSSEHRRPESTLSIRSAC